MSRRRAGHDPPRTTSRTPAIDFSPIMVFCNLARGKGGKKGRGVAVWEGLRVHAECCGPHYGKRIDRDTRTHMRAHKRIKQMVREREGEGGATLQVFCAAASLSHWHQPKGVAAALLIRST